VAVLLGAEPSGSPFHVLPVGKVGADETGRRLLAEMCSVGMDVACVGEVADRPTLFSVCFQYPDGSGGNLTTVDSAASALGPGDVDRVEPLIAEAAARTIVLATPEVDLPARRRLLELGTAHGALRVAGFTTSEVDEVKRAGMLRMVDLISLNEDEAALLVGRGLDPAQPGPFLDGLAAALLADQPGMRIVVTAGVLGAFAFEDGRWHHRAAVAVEIESTAGAGDALLGGILAATAAGVPLTAGGSPDARGLSTALDLGVALAAFGATSPHTIHPGSDLASVLGFAVRMGLTPGPPLAEAL
jgi:sugar/nucleoside kinase (ribokinase family)